VLKEGAGGTPEKAGYEADPFGNIRVRNWHKITSDEHLEHLLAHAVAYLEAPSPTHASHLATRALFFLHQYVTEHPEEIP